MILDRNAFTLVDDADYAVVEIPEAGEGATVRVRSISGDQRSRFWARLAIDEKPGAPSGNHRALACAMGMVDDKGALLFANETEGAAIIGKKHPEIIERIYTKVMELSSMTKASRLAAEKKSLETVTNSGGTSSPEPSTPATDSASTS